MDDAEKLSMEAIGRFAEASEDLRFEAADRQQLYDWVEQVLVGQQYAQQGKALSGPATRRSDPAPKPHPRETAPSGPPEANREAMAETAESG
jgi:hypothetical protein